MSSLFLGGPFGLGVDVDGFVLGFGFEAGFVLDLDLDLEVLLVLLVLLRARFRARFALREDFFGGAGGSGGVRWIQRRLSSKSQ